DAQDARSARAPAETDGPLAGNSRGLCRNRPWRTPRHRGRAVRLGPHGIWLRVHIRRRYPRLESDNDRDRSARGREPARARPGCLVVTRQTGTALAGTVETSRGPSARVWPASVV